MTAVIKFLGGPIDGEVVAADQDPTLGQAGDLCSIGLTGGRQDGVIQQAEENDSDVVWWVPHRQTLRQAEAEHWTNAKIAASMRYHEYRLAGVGDANGQLTFEARYRGLT